MQTRPFAYLQVSDPAGHVIAPLGGVTARGIAQTRLTEAKAAALGDTGSDQVATDKVRAAQSHVDYLRREAGELTYDLTCPGCGRIYMRTSPAVAHGAKEAEGGRATLG